MHQSATKCNRKCLNGNLSAISSKISLLFANNSKGIEIQIKKQKNVNLKSNKQLTSGKYKV